MVQSFLVEETTELIYDNDKLQEWKQKCEELGLEGQLELASTDKSPMPFPLMNTVMQRVYETMCPAKVSYKTYKKTTIPLEVLSLIALSEREQYFTEIQIWYDDKSPDPIAVGRIVSKQYSWQYDQYIIARWGDELKSFDILKDLALKRYTNSQTIELQSKIEEAKHKLATVEVNSKKYFDGTGSEHDVTPF